MNKKTYDKICEDLKQPKSNYFGCFAELPHTDERLEDFVKDRETEGFDESETWNLSTTIAKFVLPRLKCFRECHFDHPYGITFDEWNEILDKMIYAMNYAANEHNTTEENIAFSKVKEGLELFGKYFLHLWW